MTNQSKTEASLEVAADLMEILDGVEHEMAIECLAGVLCARAVMLGWSADTLKKYLDEQVDQLLGETLKMAVEKFGVKLPS